MFLSPFRCFGNLVFSHLAFFSHLETWAVLLLLRSAAATNDPQISVRWIADTPFVRFCRIWLFCLFGVTSYRCAPILVRHALDLDLAIFG